MYIECALSVHVQRKYFFNTFSEIKRKCYYNRCGIFSKNIKTGNLRRNTLRLPAKLVVTNFSLSQEINKV